MLLSRTVLLNVLKYLKIFKKTLEIKIIKKQLNKFQIHQILDDYKLLI